MLIVLYFIDLDAAIGKEPEIAISKSNSESPLRLRWCAIFLNSRQHREPHVFDQFTQLFRACCPYLCTSPYYAAVSSQFLLAFN